ncbi:hypothetical protein VTH06DRAFT_7743 [Thermothelomyces fergusii]
MSEGQQVLEPRPLTPDHIGKYGRRIDVGVLSLYNTLITLPAYCCSLWDENWIAARIAEALVGREIREAGASFGERGLIEYNRSIELICCINGSVINATFRVIEGDEAENRVTVPMLIGRPAIDEIERTLQPPSDTPLSHALSVPPLSNVPVAPQVPFGAHPFTPSLPGPSYVQPAPGEMETPIGGFSLMPQAFDVPHFDDFGEPPAGGFF